MWKEKSSMELPLAALESCAVGQVTRASANAIIVS